MANFSLLAKIGLDSKGFQKGLDKAKTGVSKFGKGVLSASNKLAKMGLGAAAAAFALLSKNAIALGSELSDIANNTGFATEKFQVFRGALIDAGGAAKSMEKAIVIMQKAVVQGSEGLTTYQRAFERIGLNVDDLRKMRPEDQFETIGKAIAGATDQQGALTAAIEIFGQKNAGRLIEVFKRLDKDGYGKMAKDIEKAYGIMDAETQKALDKAADTIERFKNKATINVGELIAGEADGAALRILGLEIAKAGSKLGVGMINGIMDTIRVAREAFGAFADFTSNAFLTSLRLMWKTFQIDWFEGLNKMIAGLNKIPGVEMEPINTDKLYDDLDKGIKDQGKSYNEFFQARMDQGSEFDMENRLDYSPSEFYDKEIENQKAILAASRKKQEELENLGGEGGTGSEGGAGSPLTEEDKGKIEKLEKQVKEMELDAIEAQAKGDEKAEASLEKRIKLAKRIVDLMTDFEVSQEEATTIANEELSGRSKPSDKESDPIANEALETTKESDPIVNEALEARRRKKSNPSDESITEEEKRKEKIKSLEKEINDMQLEALRAQAKGDEDAQASLEKRAELSKNILDIMKKYNVSMEEASSLAEQTAEKPEEPTADDKRSKKIEGLEKQIEDMELQAIRAQANGDEKGQAAMERRVELANRIVDIMNDHNVSQEEATRIANKMRDGEEAKAAKDAPRSELTGRDLQKAANIAGKGQAGDKSSFLGGKDIRFERDGKGNFQQFVGGNKGKVFTEEQMQAGLQKQVDKDGSESLLEKINATLEGKFVSQ